MRIVTAEEMAELDRHAIEDLKIPSLTLMENAGRAVAEEAAKMSPGPKIAVICGKGNNGGDGFVAARYLVEAGKKVEVILIGRLGEVKKDPSVNFDRLKVPILEAPDLEGFEKVKEVLKGSDLIIDALFGIGLKDELKSPYIEIITYLNSLGKPILSVDVPSGLNATDGRLMGAGIFASKTVTFAAPKTGFYKGVGPAHVGEVVVVDIGIPITSS